MVKKSVEEKLAHDRTLARRLDKLKNTVTSLGKRGLKDTFALGEALDEAAVLLRGGFTGWVRSECGIDPRTALNFRKTFRVLAPIKDWLIEKEVAPSVAVIIAAASPEGRERALEEIAAGRKLTAADAKLLVRVAVAERTNARPAGLKSLEHAARTFSAHVLAEARRIVDAASQLKDADEAALVNLATAARGVRPLMAILNHHTVRSEKAEVREFNAAVDALASAEDPEDMRIATAALVRVTRSGASTKAEDATVKTASATVAAKPASGPPSRSAIRSVSSAFKHGLTCFEICAGGGGQAAGIAKAGFRHVGLLECEKQPCDTLRAAFGPEHVIEASLVGYEPVGVGSIDLLAGGVPCAPFSRAGKQNGEYDERDLFPEALRLVKRIQPRAVMLENVAGIMDPVNDGYRARILSRLSRMGYHWDWWVLNCADFGVPQRRRRAILVAFREPAAWARFRRLESIGDYVREPKTTAVAIESYLRSRGYDPESKLLDRMNRVSPTIIGGSLRKQSSDLGQAHTRKEWENMGFVGKRWGIVAPGHEHVGDILPTNAMIARLQGFPFDWPFRGKPRDVNRQIANAFPTPVAFRLGLTIAEALTGDTFDLMDQVCHEAMRWNQFSRLRRPSAKLDQTPMTSVSRTAEGTLPTPLKQLCDTSSMRETDGAESYGEDYDIDYDRLRMRFGPWPMDLWEHQRRYGPL